MVALRFAQRCICRLALSACVSAPPGSTAPPPVHVSYNRLTRDGAGGLHYKGHITWTSLKGTGLETGRQYVGFQGDDISLNMPAGTSSISTFEIDCH